MHFFDVVQAIALDFASRRRACKLIPSQTASARSSMDRASDYGSEGWGFESLRARSGPPRCDPPVGVLHFYQALLRECFFHANPSVAFPAGRFRVRPETKATQQQACLSGGATELAQHTINRRLWAIFRAQGELFRAHAHHQTEQGELFRAQDARHGDFETNDTSATADADQCETAITNARPQTATIETTITSATEKHTNNAHFSPAKAMSVSTPHAHERAKAMTVSSEARPARAKATPVSRERFPMHAGHGRSWSTHIRMQFHRRHFMRQLAIVEIPGISWSRRLQASGNCMRNCEAIGASTTGVEGTGGPGCGARGRWRGLAGLRADAQSHTSATRHHWCGGRRRVRRARPGFEARRRTK